MGCRFFAAWIKVCMQAAIIQGQQQVNTTLLQCAGKTFSRQQRLYMQVCLIRWRLVLTWFEPRTVCLIHRLISVCAGILVVRALWAWRVGCVQVQTGIMMKRSGWLCAHLSKVQRTAEAV